MRKEELRGLTPGTVVEVGKSQSVWTSKTFAEVVEPATRIPIYTDSGASARWSVKVKFDEAPPYGYFKMFAEAEVRENGNMHHPGVARVDANVPVWVPCLNVLKVHPAESLVAFWQNIEDKRRAERREANRTFAIRKAEAEAVEAKRVECEGANWVSGRFEIHDWNLFSRWVEGLNDKTPVDLVEISFMKEGK